MIALEHDLCLTSVERSLELINAVTESGMSLKTIGQCLGNTVPQEIYVKPSKDDLNVTGTLAPTSLTTFNANPDYTQHSDAIRPCIYYLIVIFWQ